jgi:hypothetical protein
MRVVFFWLAGVVPFAVAAAAAAHHSFTAEFDISRPLKLTGSVTKIEWTNPHAWIFIDVKGDDGTVEGWAIELIGANGLLRRGLTRDTMKIGSVVTVEGFGARDGSNTGNASAVSMSSTGERIYASAPDASN